MCGLRAVPQGDRDRGGGGERADARLSQALRIVSNPQGPQGLESKAWSGCLLLGRGWSGSYAYMDISPSGGFEQGVCLESTAWSLGAPAIGALLHHFLVGRVPLLK